MNRKTGTMLNRKILTHAMRLHKRDQYTNVIATDGSKKDDAIQPWDTTYKTGPTAYGFYGGAKLKHVTGWAARFQTEIPTAREITNAIRETSGGRRIGDEADTTLAELTAILAYLQHVALLRDASNRSVLIMSDCYNGLRALE